MLTIHVYDDATSRIPVVALSGAEITHVVVLARTVLPVLVVARSCALRVTCRLVSGYRDVTRVVTVPGGMPYVALHELDQILADLVPTPFTLGVIEEGRIRHALAATRRAAAAVAAVIEVGQR